MLGPELAQHVGVGREAVRRQHQLEVDAALLADLPQREGQHLRPLGREHDADRRLRRHAYAGPAGQPSPPGRRRERRSAARRQHHAVLLARQRVVEVDGAVIASTTVGPSSARPGRTDHGQRHAGHGQPARRDRGAASRRRRGTPSDGTQRPDQALGGLAARASEAELDHRPVDVGQKPIGLSTRSSNGPIGVDGSASDRRPAGDEVLGQRTGRSQHHVRRDVALLDGLDGARPVVHDQATRSHRAPARPDCRPSSRTTLAARTGCSNRATTRYPSPTGCVRNAFIGGHSGRGTNPGDDGSDAIHTATTGARTACGTTAARRSARSATATSTRAYFPAYAGSGRTTRVGQGRRGPRSRAPAARHPGPGTRGPARGGQTSAGAHDGSRRTSGRSARGSQLVATWSMTCTPGGATIRSSPGTSSPRPSASAV